MQISQNPAPAPFGAKAGDNSPPVGMQGYGLTRKQHELLTFLASQPRCPSYSEMADALGLTSKSGVLRLLIQLEGRGYIERTPLRARSIKLLVVPGPVQIDERPAPYSHDAVLQIPLRGRIS